MILTEQQKNTIYLYNRLVTEGSKIQISESLDMQDYQYTGTRLEQDENGNWAEVSFTETRQQSVGSLGYEADVTTGDIAVYDAAVLAQRQAEYAELSQKVTDSKTTYDSLVTAGISVAGVGLQDVTASHLLRGYIDYSFHADVMLQFMTIATADADELTNGGADTGNIEVGTNLQDILEATQYDLVLDLTVSRAQVVTDFVEARKFYGRPVFTPSGV